MPDARYGRKAPPVKHCPTCGCEHPNATKVCTTCGQQLRFSKRVHDAGADLTMTQAARILLKAVAPIAAYDLSVRRAWAVVFQKAYGHAPTVSDFENAGISDLQP